MLFITVSDIFITVTVIILQEGKILRDNVRGGALTEVTFFILLSLYTPRHGYGIMQFVEEKTQGRLILGAGSLYGAIKTLQEKDWITPVDGGNEKKKEYVITETGRRIAEEELKRLKSLVNIAEEIMGG